MLKVQKIILFDIRFEGFYDLSERPILGVLSHSRFVRFGAQSRFRRPSPQL